MSALKPYRSFVSDNTRWDSFEFREGDIIISPPPKCGTTWMQMLCALLVFDSPDLGRPLTEISPWFDLLPMDVAAVTANLQAQEHRRFIKSHTPLDGLPRRKGVTYVGLGRDPRDAFISWMHHMVNMNPDIIAFVQAMAGDDAPELPDFTAPSQVFRRWIDTPYSGETLSGESLAELVHHVRTFWEQRDEPDVALFHYNDLLVDLPGQLRRLADVLAIKIDDDRIADLAASATFERMRQRADDVAPLVDMNFWQSNQGFFHKGSSGQWRDLLSDEDLHRYEERLAELAPPELVTWFHRGSLGAINA